ncbi:AEC family transporter [Pseudoalteromonas sp. JBTF-M23]|uniref:AEC family transporter n=1 Tax=Pseudoalteromonas caenipelagi TaxID=2726988 RepID=A0A849VJP4_9GAMM|nr:AEC family transporter [Pseudoalteromonas caenipelagi]NOU53040.1 AEC family transporter [Pseudoalteromonas caenipelagi]
MTALSILFPIIFVVLAGYGCAKLNIFSTSALDGLRLFIFNLAIPVFLFISMYRADLSHALSSSVMLSFYLPVLTVYLFCFAALTLVMKKNTADSAVLSLASTYSNTILVGLPIIIASLGPEYGAMVFVIITFHSALLFGCTFLLASAFQGRFVTAFKPLLINPIVVSISAGLLCNYVNLKLPQALQEGLLLLAEPAIAGALLALGASLNNYSLKGAWRGALCVSVIKLIVLPSAVFALAKWGMQLPTKQVAVLTLMSASPLGVNAYLVARQLQCQQSVLASSVVLSTLLSVLTLALWLTALVT